VRLTTSISVSRDQCPDPASQCHDDVPMYVLGVLDIAGVLLQVAASSSADTAACRMGGGRRLLGRATPPRRRWVIVGSWPERQNVFSARELDQNVLSERSENVLQLMSCTLNI
jgi:hypothetical protein